MSPTEAHADPGPALRQRLSAELPAVLRSGAMPGTPMDDLLNLMSETLAERAARIDAVAARVDAARADAEDLPWLAGWLGWGWLFRDPSDPRRTLGMEAAFPPGADRLRALLAATPALSPFRGQAAGLVATLGIASGLPGIDITQDIARQHMRITLPGLPAPWLPWARRLVAAERPAHLTWDLVPDAAAKGGVHG